MFEADPTIVQNLRFYSVVTEDVSNARDSLGGGHIMNESMVERSELLCAHCDVVVTIEGHSDFKDGEMLLCGDPTMSIEVREVCPVHWFQ